MTPSPPCPSPARRERGAGRRGEGVVQNILSCLDGAYDFSSWHWQADTPPEYVCISAVLVQHTNWRNVERAIEQLRAAGAFSLDAMLRLPEERLAELVRPAGTPLTKARRLHALARLARDHDGLDRLLALPTGELRARLLTTHGIGPETADAMVLNAAGRPAFQVDAYTIRCFRRLGLGPEGPSFRKGYGAWQRWFEAALSTPSPRPSATPLPRRGRGAGGEGDTNLYRRYHGLLVLHGKQTCRPKPRCEECCLLEMCPTGQTNVPAGQALA